MNLSAFYGYVLPEVSGCPYPVLDVRLVAAAAEFCRETLAWNEVQDPIALIDGVSDYAIDAPSGAYVYTITDVWINGRSLSSLPEATQSSSTSNEPSHFNALGDFGTLRVFPVPSSPTVSMVVKAAYVPTYNATTLPDFLSRYVDVIANGAKSELMMMPGVEWSNPQLGSYYKQQFQEGIARSKILDAHGRVPGPLRVKYRTFGS